MGNMPTKQKIMMTAWKAAFQSRPPLLADKPTAPTLALVVVAFSTGARPGSPGASVAATKSALKAP